MKALSVRIKFLALATAALLSAEADALTISRLTPPSKLFATGDGSPPYTARFIPGQRFDLQAKVQPDTGNTVTDVHFAVDGVSLAGSMALTKTDLVKGLAPNSAVASLRAYSNLNPGIHTLTAIATQSNGITVSASGNFEVVGIKAQGRKVKNVIIMLGDGMGASHRSAARIVLNGYTQGKANALLNMDTFPNTAMIMTASLNSIVTDSSPGMANYVTGNKGNNNQEGVWPDDTAAKFDNPRVEYMAEYLARTHNKKLGIVTTADVFDATPAANAVHTQDRGAGTGIVDEYFDDADKTGLIVLMGGGRKWFLPGGTAGSARTADSDYVLPADLATAWGAYPGAIDPDRDLIGDFIGAGWAYAPDKATLMSVGKPNKLLGLFSLSNMNIAMDKINGRRGTSTVVNDYGFPDQPMLEEMTMKALDVLDAHSPNGFVLMVEGASIDKQAHNMDSDRWIVDTIEFDKAVGVVRQYAQTHPDTLVLVTADHECAGASIIGASTKTDADLHGQLNMAGDKVANVRNAVVGTYESAGFPHYTQDPDGYPATTNPDYKLLIGYGANADRYEDWRTNEKPARDSQQPFNNTAPLNTYPANPAAQDAATGFFITGQVPGNTAVHTGGDIPLTAMGRGASLLNGTMDNTEVFFRVMRAVLGGANH